MCSRRFRSRVVTVDSVTSASESIFRRKHLWRLIAVCLQSSCMSRLPACYKTNSVSSLICCSLGPRCRYWILVGDSALYIMLTYLFFLLRMMCCCFAPADQTPYVSEIWPVSPVPAEDQRAPSLLRRARCCLKGLFYKPDQQREQTNATNLAARLKNQTNSK